MSAREKLRNLRRAIHDGFYAWPGGYQMHAVMTDGEVLCCECARKNYKLISWSTRTHQRDGWNLAGVEVFWEGAPEPCAHCGETIESAYGCDDAEGAK